MTEYKTKDSGERQHFDTGARRDISGDKPRPDLISAWAEARHAGLMQRGAVKYNPRNWEKGIPSSRAYESLRRHLLQWFLRCYQTVEENAADTEDHLAAIRFNADIIIHNQEMYNRFGCNGDEDLCNHYSKIHDLYDGCFSYAPYVDVVDPEEQESHNG